MSNIRRQSAQALADYISANVPALTGKVHTVAPGPEERASFPCATVLVNTITFEPTNAQDRYWSEDEADTEDPAVVQVGDFEGTFEIRIYAGSVAAREALEEAVTTLFLADIWRPGVLVVQTGPITIGAVATLYNPRIGFTLEESEWREEFAWENRRFSFIDVGASFPALMLHAAPTIQSMRSAIVHDLESDTPDEVIEVDEDGNVSPSD